MTAPTAPYPHCDQLVLHRNGTCRYCDLYPDWQQARVQHRVNFTGEDLPGHQPCPSLTRRPLAMVHAWPGNRPRPLGQPTILEHYEGNDFDGRSDVCGMPYRIREDDGTADGWRSCARPKEHRHAPHGYWVNPNLNTPPVWCRDCCRVLCDCVTTVEGEGA